MSYYDVNLSELFEEIDPYDVSNSVYKLGPNAAKLTWENAKRVAKTGALDHIPVDDILEHAYSYADELNADEMSALELRAQLAQIIAGDIMSAQDGEPSIEDLPKYSDELSVMYPLVLHSAEWRGDDVIGQLYLGG